MKHGNKSCGNKIREAYAISYTVMRYSGIFIFLANSILENVVKSAKCKMSELCEIFHKNLDVEEV